MNRICVIYWSGTGNTQAMAEAVTRGAGAELFSCEDFDAQKLNEYSAVAFGCPAMGAEVLEEEVFEPVFDACKPLLKDKRVALFGSYGWGDGEWMRNWEDDCRTAGAVLVCDSVICQETPDDDAIAACEKLGEALK